MDKKQREARRQQEDIALQRGLLWVVGAVVLEVLLVLLNRFYINYSLSEAGVNTFLALHEVLKAARIAVPVAALAALLWTAWQLKQGKKYALPLIVTIALAALSICVHVAVKYRADGMSMLYWLVIAWAVAILLAAAIIVVGLASLWLKKNDGALGGGETFRFLPKGSSYSVLLATCLASLAAVAAAMLAGGMVAYYLVYVMLAWLFALFVYYTVKLM